MDFEDWMRSQRLSSATIYKYVNALNGSISAWAKEEKILEKSIFDIRDPNSPLFALIRKMPIIQEHDMRGNNMYGSAVSKYVQYLKAYDNSTETIQYEQPEALQYLYVQEALEGDLILRLHMSRERDSKLASDKKRKTLNEKGKLVCEACDFDFSIYGDRGKNFIEVHHIIPVSSLKPGDKTKLEDLSLLCANCHRMVHVRKPWLDIEELRTLLKK